MGVKGRPLRAPTLARPLLQTSTSRSPAGSGKERRTPGFSAHGWKMGKLFSQLPKAVRETQTPRVPGGVILKQGNLCESPARNGTTLFKRDRPGGSHSWEICRKECTCAGLGWSAMFSRCGCGFQCRTACVSSRSSVLSDPDSPLPRVLRGPLDQGCLVGAGG